MKKEADDGLDTATDRADGVNNGGTEEVEHDGSKDKRQEDAETRPNRSR